MSANRFGISGLAAFALTANIPVMLALLWLLATHLHERRGSAAIIAFLAPLYRLILTVYGSVLNAVGAYIGRNERPVELAGNIVLGAAAIVRDGLKKPNSWPLGPIPAPLAASMFGLGFAVSQLHGLDHRQDATMIACCTEPEATIFYRLWQSLPAIRYRMSLCMSSFPASAGGHSSGTGEASPWFSAPFS